MRTIRRLIEAKKIEREENGEAGFSLIELIIVVVILGILVAVAIPLIGNLQHSAQVNAAKAAAANAATEIAAEIAADPAYTPALPTNPNGFTLAWETAAATDLTDLCVVANTSGSDLDATELASTAAGPGC